MYELGGHSVYALPPTGRTPFSRMSFYVHEAFHFFQREVTGWAETPEDAIVGLSPVTYVEDPSALTRPSYRAAIAAEDSILRLMAAARDRATLLSSLNDYLALRVQRLEKRPDVAAVEGRYGRREGTAEYVGCRTGSVAFATSRSRLEECLTEQLEGPMTRPSSSCVGVPTARVPC